MVNSLQHFALGVPDLKVGADFYEAFGLNTRERGDALGFRCDNRENDEIVLIETGKERQTQYVSFGADVAGMARIQKALEERHVPLEDSPFKDGPDGLWFRDPDNIYLNVQRVDAPQILTPEPVPVINKPGNVNRVGERGCPPRDMYCRPRRLGHMILFTTDVLRKRQFYLDVIGMQLSDTIEHGFAAFLRLPGGSDHHVMAFLSSTASGFHHASFEMASVDDTALAAARLLNSDVGGCHVWGPGRHGVGSNYFHYFRDPWNGMVEYFHDIDYIADDAAWKVEDWTKKDGMFLWSNDGPPPPDFGKNYEDY